MKRRWTHVPDSFRREPSLHGVPMTEIRALARKLWSRDKAGQVWAWTATLVAAMCMLALVAFGEMLVVSIVLVNVAQMLTNDIGRVVVGMSIMLLAIGGVVILPVLAGEWAHRQVHDARLARAFKALGGRRACPGCLYDLQDLQDGRTIDRCPECGLAFTHARKRGLSNEFMREADWKMLGVTLWRQRPIWRAWTVAAGVFMGGATASVIVCTGLPTLAAEFAQSVCPYMSGGDVSRALAFMIGAAIAVIPGVLAGTSTWRSVREERIRAMLRDQVFERLCPRCLYELKGLGDVKTCPECGWMFGAIARDGDV